MNLTDYFGSPVCTRLILTLAHFLWQGMAIALLALVAAKLLVRRSPRARYAIYLVSLFAMLLSVAVTYALVRVPDRDQEPVTAARRGLHLHADHVGFSGRGRSSGEQHTCGHRQSPAHAP